MNVAICDDVPNDVIAIEEHIKQYSFENGIDFSIEKYYDSKTILESKKIFDIAFLDIEIDENNGLEIGRCLQKKNPNTSLIYITSYDHYLDDALDIGITRFFNKPIDSVRFYEGIKKAISKVDNTEVKFPLYDGGQGFATVQCKDIIYAEIIGRKTKIVTKDKSYISNESIKKWKEKLNKSYFVSPHNSFIINLNYITYYERASVTLDNSYVVPVAYSKRTEFKRIFLNYWNS